MSKKGHKGRSRKKGSVADRRADGRLAPVVGVAQGMEAVDPASALEWQPPPSLEPAEVEQPPRPEVSTAPAAVANANVANTNIETPIAFEAPPLAPVDPVDSADASIPPVTSADLDSPFFDSHAHAALAFDDPEEHEERDPRMVLKLAPATAKRRAQLQRYVRFAVGAASVLCLAALVKVAVAHNHEEPAGTAGRRSSVAMQVAPPPAPQPVETSQRAAEIPAPPPPAELVAEPAPAPAAPTASAAATDTTAAAATADPAPPAEPDPKAAAKEKHDSQLALERGKVGDAIDAGERSVALDPSDAEAWLILGAAYQEKGDQKNARRSFKACLEQGKRGPKWECAQFPH
jgi:hypothetical protein